MQRCCPLCQHPLPADTRVFARHSKLIGVRSARRLIFVLVRTVRPDYVALVSDKAVVQ